ncbi:UNVERIFIED_CONTAM: hypothetical protein FKN15_048512 [Acipenser sinensis]
MMRNWCAFVHSRMVTTVVSCGTEQYTIRSQKPCPHGTPDCQLVMYKLSLRPAYREKQVVFTALQWRCCPGHMGANCEETDPGKVMRMAGEEGGLQNDIQHPGSLLQDLHSLLGENRTMPDLNQNRTAAPAGYPVPLSTGGEAHWQ